MNLNWRSCDGLDCIEIEGDLFVPIDAVLKLKEHNEQLKEAVKELSR